MLITELKSKETILSLIPDTAFVIICHGCKELRFPEKEADALVKELSEAGKLTGSIVTDYICNPENLKLRLEKHAAAIEAAGTVLVLSCGVGVQTVASYLENKKVCAGCDTYALPGFQGLTPLHFVKLAGAQDWQGCKDKNIMDCMECRCCEYICSSKLPLVTMIKMGKNGVRGLK
jgi:electron transport complex protein RnfC